MKRQRNSPWTWPLRIIALAVLLGLWAVGNTWGGISTLVLPTIPTVVSAFISNLGEPKTYQAALTTLSEIFAAFGIASAAGLIIGFWAARTRLRIRIFEPLFVWGYLAPLVLFYPVFILSFGIGVTSKILFGAVSAFFPIAYNSVRAFATVDPTVLRVASAYGASPFQTDFLVKLPAALPLIRSGVRIGAAMAIITVILAEMLAATSGLGYELSRASQTFATPYAYATILALLVLVALMQGLVQVTLTPRRDRNKTLRDDATLTL